jgi:uncharacterized protein Yka (UPF0111/DUF47 family)
MFWKKRNDKLDKLARQMNQVYKSVNKYGKYIEELSKDVAILKKDSHPPVFTKEQYEKLNERVKTIEAFFDNIEKISSDYIKDIGN